MTARSHVTPIVEDGAQGSFATTSTSPPTASHTTAAMEKSISKPILLSI